ncbi:hypothetical protein IJ103_02025 [Candidatus Saccharibacteria bacterium]|nr:hypothetical protein [Candidatus Saccharibacteria bacterium]MBQ9017001.1 hypothetical protein [Candidatus Saccharibacteria bacterium]
MKVTNKGAKRNYHISLLVFLIALGLVPASLLTSGAFAETEQASAEQVIEPEAEKAEEPKQNEPELANPIDEPASAPVEEPTTAETAVNITYTVEEPTYVEPTAQEYVAPVAQEYVAPAVEIYDQINIAGNTVPIFYSSDTLIDAGSKVGLYGEHFLYGHNTANVFGGLQYLSVGSQFTVTLNGNTKTYQIVGSDLQTKSHFEGETIITTKMTGMTVKTKMKIMKAITAYGEYGGNYYDYILMTCAGTSYGNGDASHRLVLFANAV